MNGLKQVKTTDEKVHKDSEQNQVILAPSLTEFEKINYDTHN